MICSGLCQIEKSDKKGMMPAYTTKKISDEDLDALTQYLLSLRK